MWKKDDFIPISNFWELFVIESIPKCSTSFLIHREIQSGLCYWLNIVHCKTNAILIVQWITLFVFTLPWKGKSKLLQKWILCQDNQIKSNHNHIYKHFILRLSYLSVTVEYANATRKYHFIKNFIKITIEFNLWIEDSFFKVNFFEFVFIDWQASMI